MPKQKFFTLKIGGQAGQGVKSAGLMFAKVATRSGYYTFDYTEYPSLIRGGHNVMQVTVSKEEVTSTFKTTDLLVALNQETIDKHYCELLPGSGVLFDCDNSLNLSQIPAEANQFGIPLSKFATDAGGKELLINTVALGSVLALLGGNLSLLQNLIAEEFADKDSRIVETNKQAAELGFDYVKQNFQNKVSDTLDPMENVPTKMIINGNDAVALGAIAGGLQFASIYPMSPISGILQTLASYQEKYGYVYKQPEDEISAITQSIGASFAGARSLTATSGGGFSLMAEGYGLAGMTETPIVIVDGMRGGPATGLPTWNEQSDLQFALHAHQGDFPRIVLAAGDAKEAFDLTMQALNLADKYQTPVMLLIDKDICENDQSFQMFDVSNFLVDRGKFTTQKVEDFQRFASSEDGISLRSIPGSGNYFIGNSDEHSSVGLSSEEIEDRNTQMQKRMKKLQTCAAQDMTVPVIYGPKEADISFVSWGSNKGSILQAIKDYPNVNYLHITWMNPFPVDAVRTFLENAKYLVNVECNFTAQLASLVREKTGIEILDKMLKYDGRPFYPEEIVKKIESVFSTYSVSNKVTVKIIHEDGIAV